MNITLQPITADNFGQAINLKVTPEQESFVASNVLSLAQSKFYPFLIPVAIYEGEEMVGFLMYMLDEEDGRYWLTRLMVAPERQGGVTEGRP